MGSRGAGSSGPATGWRVPVSRAARVRARGRRPVLRPGGARRRGWFAQLRDCRFLAVVGASGSGKSSLVRAGLVPALRAGGALRRHDAGPGSGRGAAGARSRRARPPWSSTNSRRRSRSASTSEARARFFDDLIDLSESGTTNVVVALRADFYGRCAEHPRLGAAVAAHQRLLGPMQADELRAAIEGPARAAGLRLESGLSDALVADVEGEPGGLPLLSHALYETWVRRDGQVLTRAGYVEAGGVRGAIAQTAEDVFRGCTEEEQALVRRLLLRLVEPGEGSETAEGACRWRSSSRWAMAPQRRPRCSSSWRLRGCSSSARTRRRSRTRRSSVSGRGSAGGWQTSGRSCSLSAAWPQELAPGTRPDGTKPISTAARDSRPPSTWRGTSGSSLASSESFSRWGEPPRRRSSRVPGDAPGVYALCSSQSLLRSWSR